MKFLRILAVLCLLVKNGNAAVSLVSTGSWQFQGLGGTTLTFAHNITTENFLVVYTEAWTNVTGVTYNGTAMTNAGAIDDFSTTYDLDVWYLVSPATGNNNVVVTRTGTSSNTNALAVSYSGVNTSSPISGATTATDANCGGSPFAPITVTTVSGDYTFGAMASGAGTGSTLVTEIGTGQASISSKHSSGLENLAASRTIATGTSTTLEWQCSTGVASGSIGFVIEETATATTATVSPRGKEKSPTW